MIEGTRNGDSMDERKKVEEYVKKYHMIETGDKIIAGVSGGADSVCLFYMLFYLKQQNYDFSFIVVHVNHGLRGESARLDQAYVESMAEEFGIECETVSVQVRDYASEHRLSEEEAGRILRYQAFEDAARRLGCGKIALAHTMNDNAETVLFQMARGSGLTGCSGIPPVRGNVVRPLLCLKREEVEAILTSISLSYRTDPTNFSERYTRNRIRHQILPLLREQVNEKAVEHICAAAEMLRMAAEYLETDANLLYQRIVTEENGKYCVSVGDLIGEKEVLRSFLFHKLLKEASGSHRNLEACHVKSLQQLLFSDSGKKVDLPYGLEAAREYDVLVVQNQEAVHQEEWETALFVPGEVYFGKGNKRVTLSMIDFNGDFTQIPENDYTKWFDYDKICQALTLRNRRAGDYLVINREGGRKKLKDYFIDQKIIRKDRDRIPLIADGSHILWVIGERISEEYKVAPDTKKVLRIAVMGGNDEGRDSDFDFGK